MQLPCTVFRHFIPAIFVVMALPHRSNGRLSFGLQSSSTVAHNPTIVFSSAKCSAHFYFKVNTLLMTSPTFVTDRMSSACFLVKQSVDLCTRHSAVLYHFDKFIRYSGALTIGQYGKDTLVMNSSSDLSTCQI